MEKNDLTNMESAEIKRFGEAFFARLFSPAVFVWGILLVMTLMMLGFLMLFSCPIPYVDAWIIAEHASADTWSWSWLWEQQNEHRYPIVKGLAWICYHTYGSMQPLSVMSVLTCCATSAGLILAARRLRGRTDWMDAVFPVIFLNGSHIENILWTHQLFFVAAGCLACWCGIYLMAKPESHRCLSSILAALALLLLPLHGVMGLAFAPFLGIGFFYHGWVGLKRDPKNRIALINLVVPFLAGALCMAYVSVDFHIPEGHQDNLALGVPLWQRAAVVLECAATGLGALGNRLPLPVGQSLFALAILAVGTLAVLWRKKQISSEEALSLLLIFAAVWSLPLAIGIGRSSAGGAAPRYTILAVPVVTFIILFWIRFAAVAKPSRPDGCVARFSRFVQVGFFTIFAAFLMYHVSMAIEYGKERMDRYHALLSDIDNALPQEAIAGRGWSYWCWSEPAFRHYLEQMGANGVAPFDRIRPAGLLETDEIPLSQNSWASRAPIAIPLEIPGGKRHVDAVRLTFRLACAADWRSDTATYWDSASVAFPNVQRNQIKMGASSPGVCDCELTIWIDAEVSRLELVPNAEGEFSLDLYKAVLCERAPTTTPDVK
ncbi:MAG: hypothetical protein Q4D38_08945 [Planctomycetia bacterium]|nr:hypothetical protein [Planctomycetia bacterium]